jgi:hypothetical protein
VVIATTIGTVELLNAAMNAVVVSETTRATDELPNRSLIPAVVTDTTIGTEEEENIPTNADVVSVTTIATDELPKRSRIPDVATATTIGTDAEENASLNPTVVIPTTIGRVALLNAVILAAAVVETTELRVAVPKYSVGPPTAGPPPKSSMLRVVSVNPAP